MPSDITQNELKELSLLLQERLTVIGDHQLRAGDPDRHLQELQRISQALLEVHARLRGRLPARLEHFMTQCSYDKALAFIQAL